MRLKQAFPFTSKDGRDMDKAVRRRGGSEATILGEKDSPGRGSLGVSIGRRGPCHKARPR
jgi:hypothetical protein